MCAGLGPLEPYLYRGRGEGACVPERPSGAAARWAAIPDRRPYLPKWLADAAVPVSEGMAHQYRVVVAPSAACAINRICRLMKRDAYGFSRLRAVALRKQVTARYEEAPPGTRLHLAAYRELTPSE